MGRGHTAGPTRQTHRPGRPPALLATPVCLRRPHLCMSPAAPASPPRPPPPLQCGAGSCQTAQAPRRGASSCPVAADGWRRTQKQGSGSEGQAAQEGRRGYPTAPAGNKCVVTRRKLEHAPLACGHPRAHPPAPMACPGPPPPFPPHPTPAATCAYSLSFMFCVPAGRQRGSRHGAGDARDQCRRQGQQSTAVAALMSLPAAMGCNPTPSLPCQAMPSPHSQHLAHVHAWYACMPLMVLTPRQASVCCRTPRLTCLHPP